MVSDQAQGHLPRAASIFLARAHLPESKDAHETPDGHCAVFVAGPEGATGLVEESSQLLDAAVAELASELHIPAGGGLVELVEDGGSPACQQQQG